MFSERNRKTLESTIAPSTQADYPVQSRIHRLQSLSHSSVQAYVKRDDELGFGISGSKFRKYRSLVPFLVKNAFEEVVLIGGAYSNHILGLSPLLIENGIKPTLFLRGEPAAELKGNAKLIELLVPRSFIHRISRAEWDQVEIKAQDYLAQQSQNKSCCLIPEGGAVKESLPGALTLALDICRNESISGVAFDHLFVEAGTGFMALALMLGMAWLEHPAVIHVLLLADHEDTFRDKLQRLHGEFVSLMGTSCPYPSRFILHKPSTAASFGSVNQTVREEVKRLAREEGFFADPIYSAKLFLETKKISTRLSGKILVIHSGGAITLAGFSCL